jgi:ADP-ribose pyrophosphatase
MSDSSLLQTNLPAETTPLVPEITLSSQRLEEGVVVNFRRDQARNAFGQTVVREVVEHPGGVCVLPVLSDGRFVMVRQFRYPLGRFLLEFPAGKLDVPGEAPEDAIRRELLEETGYLAHTWESLGSLYTAPGFCNEKIYLYRATDLHKPETPVANVEDEAIECHLLEPQEILKRLQAHEIEDAKTLSLLSYALIAGYLPKP